MRADLSPHADGPAPLSTLNRCRQNARDPVAETLFAASSADDGFVEIHLGPTAQQERRALERAREVRERQIFKAAPSFGRDAGLFVQVALDETSKN